MKKRGNLAGIIIGLIFLIIFLMPFSVYAENNLNLSKTKYGAGQNFEGTLSFEMNGAVPYDNNIKFEIDGDEFSGGVLGDAMSHAGVGGILQPSIKFETPASVVNVEFTEAGNKTSVGIDLVKAKTISSINFDLSSASSNPIKGLKLDFKNDGTIDWIYRGEPLAGVFPSSDAFATNDSYLIGFNNMDVEVRNNLKGENAGETFCEKVDVEPSNEYYIEAKVGRKDSGGQLIGALVVSTARNSPGTLTADDCYDNANNPDSNIFCCNLSFNSQVTGSVDLADLNCKINKALDNKQQVFACVFQDAGTEGIGGNYTIGQEIENNGRVVGFYRGTQTGVNSDYMIRIYNHKFNTLLNGTAHVTLDVDAINNAKIKPKEKLAINTISENSGDVSFKNLVAGITLLSGADSDVVVFNPINELPRRVNYSGLVSIPLNYFNNIVSPSSLGNYIISGGVDLGEGLIYSNDAEFNVVAGPKAVINADTVLPTIGDTVNFDAGQSSPVNKTRVIVSYSWDFGDNSTGNGSIVRHVYLKEGRYSVKLVVLDNGGISGSDTVVVDVAGVSGSIVDKINSSLKTIEEMKKRISGGGAAVSDSAGLLGINDILSSAKANVSVILNKAVAINGNSSLNESQKNDKFVVIKNELDKLMSDVPINIIVSVVKFDGTVDSLTGIPTATELGLEDTEDFELKVLKAQKSVSAQGEVREINLQYQDKSDDKFLLIKKTVSGGGDGGWYEIMPNSLSKRDILTEGAQLVTTEGSIFRVFDVNEIVYTVEGSITDGAETKTIFVPQDLASIQVDNSGGLERIKAVCGNEICEAGEDSSCSDCKKSPWLMIIITVIVGLIAIGAVYYFMVFKNKQPFIPKKGEGGLFKTEKDREALVRYIDDSLNKKGFTDQQIVLALRKKGWKEEQINEAMHEVKKGKHAIKW